MIRIKEGFKGERSLVIPKMIVDYMVEDPLCATLHITDIGYYPHADHHYRERRLPIQQYVLIYCVEGSGWYRIGNTRYEVSSNRFFILPAGEPHAYGSNPDDTWTIYWIHFAGTLASTYADGLRVPLEVAPSDDSRIRDRIGMFEEIFFTLKQGYNRENLHYAHSILHHFLGTLKYVSQYRLAGNADRPVDRNDVCSRAIHFMKERIEQRITLRQLADFTGYTPNHFSNLFSKSIGHAPLSYFNLLKMQAAAQMLDSTGMKVNQIAAKLGYDDFGYFTRLFSKIMGTTPSAYRTMTRG